MLLVMVENRDTIRPLAEFMEQAHVAAVFACSVKEARESAGNHSLSLVLVDVGSSNPKGFDFADHIRNSREFCSLPLVFLMNPDSAEHLVAKAFEKGAEDVFTRPLNPLIFNHRLALIQEALASRSPEFSQGLSKNKPQIFETTLNQDKIDPVRSVKPAERIVLVVDDDPALGELTSTMLVRMGFKPLFAMTGQAAIDRVIQAEGAIDLVLLDVELPDMKGNEIYPHIMQIQPGLSVVVCSGHPMDGPVQALLDMGADAFLQKPFGFVKLQRMLQTLIERRRYPRFRIEGGLVVFGRGQGAFQKNLLDISLGGAAVEGGLIEENASFMNELELVADKGEVRIPGISFQWLLRKIPPVLPDRGAAAIHRVNLCFSGLDQLQSRNISRFITDFSR